MRKCFIGFAVIIGFIGAVGLRAAEAPIVYLAGPETAVAPGSEFKVAVLLDSDEPINALEIELFYPSGLQFLGFDNSASIVGFWHQGPRVFTDGRIELVGGILEPFQGIAGEIISLDFRVSGEGNYVVDVLKSDLYLADGVGTRVLADARREEFNVSAGAPSYSLVVAADTTPPTIEAEITMEPAGNFRLVAYSARDSESGVSHVELRTKRLLKWTDWRLALNPLVIEENVWAVQVRALNNRNQAAVKTLYLWSNFFRNFWPVALAAVFLIFLFLMFYNKYKRQKA